jgi:hypothetical protein
MNPWSTFRLVPPIATEAVAWTILSMATYLAAEQFQPVVAGRTLAPLALAASVQFTLIHSRTLLSSRFAGAVRRAPVASVAMAVALLVCPPLLALLGSDAVAAKVVIAWVLLNAFCLTWAIGYAPESIGRMPSAWSLLPEHRENAMLIDAAGLVIAAAALLATWVHAGPLAFAAMMGAGLLILRLFTNWIIVLYLLDQQNRGGAG